MRASRFLEGTVDLLQGEKTAITGGEEPAITRREGCDNRARSVRQQSEKPCDKRSGAPKKKTAISGLLFGFLIHLRLGHLDQTGQSVERVLLQIRDQ